MDNVNDLLKTYKKLAKRADQRLVRLEGYAHREGFTTATKWAYAKAQRDIRKYSGNDATRFNTKFVVRTNAKGEPNLNDVKMLEAKISDIKEFLESPTSTLKGITSIYKKKADNINKKFGTKFTWEDLANYYLSGTADKLDKKFGSKTALHAIASIQKQSDDVIKGIQESKEKYQVVEDNIVNDTVGKILRDQGLDLSMIVK